jgi:ABC-type multidrug transport system fused ATPase/permease subunit
MQLFSIKVLINKYIRWILISGFVLLFCGIAALFLPGYGKYVLDSISSSNIDIGKIVFFGISSLLITALSVCLKRLSTDLFVKRLQFDLNNRFIESLLLQPVKKLAEIGNGKIFSNFTEDMTAFSNMVRSGIELVRIPLEMVLASAFLIYTNWFFGIFVLILLPPVTLIGKKVGQMVESIKYPSN